MEKVGLERQLSTGSSLASTDLPPTPAHKRGVAHKAHKARLLDVDDLPSTAASSVVHSPNGGPEPLLAGVTELGPALAAALESAVEADAAAKAGKLRAQVERCFRPENLMYDIELRSHMTRCGWVHLQEVLRRPDLQRLRASVEEAAAALATSETVQLAGDFKQVRARDPYLRSAFGPPQVEDADSSDTSGPLHWHVFQPEVDVADEELTVAASLEDSEEVCVPLWQPKAQRAARWPAEAAEQSQRQSGTRTSRRRARPAVRTGTKGAAPLAAARPPRCHASPRVAAAAASVRHKASDLDLDVELLLESSTSGAWVRMSDDAYASPAGSLLQW